MTYRVTKRFASWSQATYGQETPPGVVSRQALALDGDEGSHLGQGWHAAEQGFRWTQQRAAAYLHRFKGQDTLELELSAGPAQLGAVSVTVEVAGISFRRRLSDPGWEHVRLRLPALRAEQRILPITIAVECLRDAMLLGGGDLRQLGVAVRWLRLLGKAQAIDLPLSAVCNPEHWNHPIWQQCVESLSCATPYVLISQDNRSRKIWEWVHGMAGLARLGCLTPGARALGIATGHEPPIYWLASRVAMVYATDLYRGWFAGQEANPDVLDDPAKYAPYAYPPERVAFFPMSGTEIAFGDGTIDFIFSFCSIEHFGGPARSLQSLREMARVLRPGGIAAVSTELLLNQAAPRDALPEMYLFSPWELYEDLIEPSGLRMIGDIAPANLARYCADPLDTDDPASIAAPPQWFVLRSGEALFTSVMLFLQKV